MRLFSILSLCVLGFSSVAIGKVIYVDDDASGGDGLSWSSAFNDLQDAFDSCETGDEIWIAAGIYSKEDGFSLKDINDLQKFHILGGFKNGDTNKFSRDYSINSTIISGDILQDDKEDWSGRTENQMLLDIEGSYNIYFDGISFMNGAGTVQGYLVGDRKAAISLDSTEIVFHKCLFYRNGYSTGDPMGLMSADNSSVDFVNCIFIENTGGIFHGKSTTTQSANGYLHVNFQNSVFYKNMQSSLGALVWISAVSNTASANARLRYSTVVGDHTFFSSPFATTYGDGNVFHSTGTLFNNDLTDQGIDSETYPSIYSDFEFVNIDNPKGWDGIWGTADDGLRIIYKDSHKLTSEKYYDNLDLDQDGINTEAAPFNIYGTHSNLTPIKMLGAYDLSSTSSTDIVEYVLTLSTSEGGSVSGAGNYEHGVLATIQAIAADGYKFFNWTGDYSGSLNPSSVTINSNKRISASFVKDTNDSDSDGLSNYEELVTYTTNPNATDSDEDGFTDYEEVERGLNPNSSDQAVINAVMELKAMKAENVTPIVNGWYYVPKQGWLWTSKDAYPFTYSATDKDWMYFQSGNEKPRFYRYKTKDWITLD